MSQNSKAWAEIGGIQTHTPEETSEALSILHRHNDDVTIILGMLEVTKEQSNLSKDNSYIFLSRIDGIIAYMEKMVNHCQIQK